MSSSRTASPPSRGSVYSSVPSSRSAWSSSARAASRSSASRATAASASAASTRTDVVIRTYGPGQVPPLIDTIADIWADAHEEITNTVPDLFNRSQTRGSRP